MTIFPVCMGALLLSIDLINGCLLFVILLWPLGACLVLVDGTVGSHILPLAPLPPVALRLYGLASGL